MRAQRADYVMTKVTDGIAKILIDITGDGQSFVGILTISDTNGANCSIFLNVCDWNETQLYISLAGGVKLPNVNFHYKREENNNVSVFISGPIYATLKMCPLYYEITSSISYVSEIPENAIEILL